MCSELGNSCIRVAVDYCSVTECRPWRPPFQTGKTVHVHAKHYKHNQNGRTAPGVRGHGSVPPSHLENVVTGIVLQQRPAFSASFKKKKKNAGLENAVMALKYTPFLEQNLNKGIFPCL